MKNNQPKVVVIGGGTGSFTLLGALKTKTRNIAALVNMVDDGGSTGVLRDELGALPPGDIRQCLVALSNFPQLRELFNYRFEGGEGLKGHAFGNLFLTALEKVSGDFLQSVELASKLLAITGTVEPITTTDTRLRMRNPQTGETVEGQYFIQKSEFSAQRPELWLDPIPEVNHKAIEHIMDADIVIVAPGNLYTSLGPTLMVPGIGKALSETKALRVYVCNLVTKPGQTDGFCVNDYADEIERMACAHFIDHVLYNNAMPTKKLLDTYAAEGELPVAGPRDDAQTHYAIHGCRLISSEIWQPPAADPIATSRTLIRHDPVRTVNEIFAIYDAIKT